MRDIPVLKYLKNDLILSSDSLPLNKKCRVVCLYENNYYIAKFKESLVNENFRLKPYTDEFQEFNQNDKDKFEILGMVVLREQFVNEEH